MQLRLASAETDDAKRRMAEAIARDPQLAKMQLYLVNAGWDPNEQREVEDVSMDAKLAEMQLYLDAQLHKQAVTAMCAGSAAAR